MRRLPLLAALAVFLLVAAGPARAAIYQWTDAAGTPHFSDRPEDVPPQYRQQLPPELRGDAKAAKAPPAHSAGPNVLSRALSAVRRAPAKEQRTSARPHVPKLAFLRHLGLGTLAALALATIAFSFFFYAFLIQVACRICSEAIPAFSRALAVVGVQFMAGVGVAILELATLGFSGAAPSPILKGINSLLGFGVNVAVLRAMLGQTLGKALAVQLVTMLICIVLAIALILGLVIVFGGMGALHAAG